MRVVLWAIFVLAFLLRLKAYLSFSPFWLDECSLSLSILNRGLLGYFAPLEHTQSAPPFFMFDTKLLTLFFGEKELVMRFIPFLCSLLSIGVFYLFTKKFFIKNHTLIAANLLFALNYRLIYFAQEFKQYSSDVLLVLLVLLFFQKIDLESLTAKKQLLLGVLMFLVLLYSLPVAFVLGAFIIYNIKKCKIWMFLAPIVALGIPYYVFSLLPSKKLMLDTYASLWAGGFLSLNPLSLLSVLRENLLYFFLPNTFVLLGIILLTLGIVVTLKEKSKLNTLLLLTLGCALLASFLHLYPIKERVALYLLPLFLTLMLKPLDSVSLKKRALGVFIVFLTFVYFLNLSYVPKLFQKETFVKTGAKGVMELLKDGYSQGDVVVVNDASSSIYAYYAKYFGFYTPRYVGINLVKYDRVYYTGLLNQLPKGQTYWLFYAYDYVKKPVVPYVKEWVAGKEVLKVYEDKGSYLAKVRL